MNNNSQKTILLVDDEANVPQALMRKLKDEPNRLLAAYSAAEALNLLQKEEVQVVISDEKMPQMSGAELVSRIRQSYPHILCMILSGYCDFNATIKALNQGEIFRFLTKPCDPLEIATNIRLALAQQELLAQSRKISDQYQQELLYRKKLEQQYPEIFKVVRDEKGIINID